MSLGISFNKMDGIRDGIDDTQGTSSEIQGTKSKIRCDSVPIVTCMYPDINRDIGRGIKRKKGVGEGVSKMQTYKELDADGNEMIGIKARAVRDSCKSRG